MATMPRSCSIFSAFAATTAAVATTAVATTAISAAILVCATYMLTGCALFLAAFAMADPTCCASCAFIHLLIGTTMSPSNQLTQRSLNWVTSEGLCKLVQMTGRNSVLLVLEHLQLLL